MMRSEMMSSCARVGAVALAAMAVTLLAGCGQKKDVAAADANGSEVVAKVNGDDVTANQLAIAIQKQRGMRPDAGDAASKPADDAVQKFYDGRPTLFAQRKMYTLQRVDIQAPDARRSEIGAKVATFKTPAELTDWLKSQKLAFTTKQEQDASEQLPPVVLEKLATMQDGQSMVVPAQFGVSALTRVSSTAAPKALADARPAIEQFLANQGRREVIMNLQKTIRDGAKVEYEGRFAALAAANGGGATPVPTPTPTPIPTSTLPAASAASQTTPAQK